MNVKGWYNPEQDYFVVDFLDDPVFALLAEDVSKLVYRRIVLQRVAVNMEDEILVQLVQDRVRQIPAGQVMSYGQVGDAVGCSAREAGWAMNQVADENTAPWQRVVGSDGYLRIAKRSAAWAQRQRALLEAEGVTFKPNDCVDMAKHQWGTISEMQTRGKSVSAKQKPAAETLELGLE